MIALVYSMTRLSYPETNYLFLLIILLVFIGWILRDDLGDKGLFAGLVCGHIAFVLIFCQNDGFDFLQKSFLLLGLPLCLFLLIRTHRQLSDKGYIVVLILIVFSASVVRDLTDHISLTAYLYHGQTHPREAYGIKTDAQSPEVIQNREIAPLSRLSGTAQSIRYLSLVYRQPYVFSPVMAISQDSSIPYPRSLDDISLALSIRRWSSFLLLKNYFKLINSDILPLAIKEMFCVEKPVFQFKQGVIALENNEVAGFLNKLGATDAVALLEKCLIVTRAGVDNSLAEFIKSTAEIETLINGTAAERGDPGMNHQFSYSVAKCGYDAFSIDVVTAKQGPLYWCDGFDEGWRAYINGQETPIYRANVNFKTIVLQAGRSHIDFIYERPPFKMALFAFYGTLGLAIMLAFTTRFLTNK
jgi:hypothetical protein